MKDLYQVLRQKELDIQRVQKEIATLHLVIPLLVDEADWAENGRLLSSRNFEEREPRA
jgi:hypothetical protein